MLMFINGFIAGILGLEVVIVITLRCVEAAEKREEFVKKLIEKKGWAEARWDLETAHSGKYMSIWRRLYKAHIEGDESNGEN